MSLILRSIRNVLRNPMRLILVVLLLGVSLMFVAAMVGLNSSAQQQLANVNSQIDTGITINYATNEAASSGSGSSGNSGSGGFGGFGGGGGFGGFGGSQTDQSSTPIPNSVVTQVQSIAGVSSVDASLRREDSDGTLKTPSNSFKSPTGRSFTLPITVSGISNGDANFTLGDGSSPTISSGRSFASSDANADVAMMSTSLASANNFKVGSTFTIKGSGSGTTFTIIGLYTTANSNPFENSTITIPMNTMEKLFNVAGVDSITAYAATMNQVDTVAASIRTTLGNQYDVVTQESSINTITSSISSSQNSVRLAMIVSIITAAVVIIFAVVLLVRERTMEIGTLKAIGASHWQVIRQFWSEVLTLSILSAAFAVLLLVTIGPAVARQFSVADRGGGFGGGGGLFAGRGGGGFAGGGSTFFGGGAGRIAAVSLTPESVLLIVGLGIGLALLASLIPTWYVARLKPAEVLRTGN